MRRALVIAALIGAGGLAGCGPVTFGDLPAPAPVPADVALERHEAREQADAERLRRCQMGSTGVERDDRECRKGL